MPVSEPRHRNSLNAKKNGASGNAGRALPGLEVAAENFIAPGTASLSVPGHENSLAAPLIRVWKGTSQQNG